MAERNDFRMISTFDLRPVFMSLGLPQSAFKAAPQPGRAALFDAALNADASRPDTVWLFKGSDYHAFNLRTGDFEGSARQIAVNWGGASWPPMFSSGIDAAVWGGPAFPAFWYFFKGDHYLRLNSSQGGPSWLVDVKPEPLVNGWFSAQGTWFGDGCDAALHGLSPRHHAKLHLFRNGEYMRHNLLDGHRDIGPCPIRDIWRLPEPFASKIDLAFYGTGAEEETIFFFSGTQCALYDTQADQTVRVCAIDERFPAFGAFMRRPQLFLVEDYRLETYVGPPRLGRLVETRSVPPGTETRTLMVTETLDTSQTTLRQSLLESQDASVVNHFNKQLDKRAEQEEGSEKYRYHMNADFHGDASANSLWGGEVNAELGVQGGSDSLREKFAESTFETIGSQVTEAARQLSQRTYESTAAIEHRERVLKQEEILLRNPGERLRVFEFYQQLQPYLTLLVLKDIRLAVADGREPPRIVPLSQMGDVARRLLAGDDEPAKLIRFVAGELSAVEDQDRKTRSLIQANPDVPVAGPLMLATNPVSEYLVQHANGDVQKITTRGLIIKAAKEWLAPTLTMIAIEVNA